MNVKNIAVSGCLAGILILILMVVINVPGEYGYPDRHQQVRWNERVQMIR